MFGKWRYAGGALILALGLAVVPVEAQRGPGMGGRALLGPGGPNFGSSLQVALEHQGELGLTQDQVAQLEELKAIIDEDVAGLVEEIKATREGIRNGDIARDEGFREMEALRGKLITASAPLRGRVQEILTVEQHNELRPLVRQTRLGVGRGQARGMAGQPRGMLGGAGPRMRFPGQGRGPALGFRRASPNLRPRGWRPQGLGWPRGRGGETLGDSTRGG